MSDGFLDLLSEVARENGFQDYKVEVSPGAKEGTNYLGEILRVKIRGKINNNDCARVYFVKTLPREHPLRKINLGTVFNQEIQFYEEVLPIFDSIIGDKNTAGIFHHAIMHKYRSEEFKEVIIMNDLTSIGFTNSCIGRVLDYQHTAAVLKQLGFFHALSFATRYYHPEKFDKITKNRWFDFLFNNEAKQIGQGVSYDSVEAALDHLDNESAILAIKDLLPKVHDVIADISNPEAIEPYVVLNHADLWANNIMFKYKDDNLTDVLFLDYQVPRYCSPVLDLFFFLFTSVDDEVRGRDLAGLFNIYYFSLRDKLIDLQCDPNELFPENVFQQHLKKFCPLGLVNAFVMLPIFADEDHVVNGDNVKSSTDPAIKKVLSSNFTDLYKKRVNAIVDDCLNCGLL